MDVKKIGMIGTGSMGGMMSLLFAEHGIHTHYYDPSKKNVEALQSHAKESKHEDKITYHGDHKSLCEALEDGDNPKVFMFSIPHGGAADDSIDALEPYLKPGDIIMDASNEHWKATERRQGRLEPKGIHYIGMGVSGGYQSARHGPSISPGGNKEALDKVFPFLQKIACKDTKGRPCVAKLGPGGCGHYVKMIHNGIEHGMMTALCEAWAIMNIGLGMEYEEIGAVFEKWNGDKEKPLRDNFLINIGADICRTKDEKGNYVLANVRDKVVQDVDNSEGTGTWSVQEGTRLHVPDPTIAVSHLFRVASADAARRQTVKKALEGKGVKPARMEGVDKDKFMDDLYNAVYASFLMCFIQGLHVLSKANEENDWKLDFADVLQLWRKGCIIQSDGVVDLLETVYRSREHNNDDLLGHKMIAGELAKTYPALKRVVLKAIEFDLHAGALGTSLEYYKYSGSTELPTQFQEAELDYFGAHMFDLKTAQPGKPVTGDHHFEWKPAKGILETDD
ncbi:hypothetical protein SMACR_01516 [Sordaria macrospora]|uniref:6-phosphogluconate dehydrogenase, decarboxylating n=2 Tax=Sordaria macrospora TaxID=5147 RepID=F7VR20_SORMK|nr:uncharacterized protein SMAC_01516 [Sordaria macrospora k-hell]KAA8623945.1 hypothetical protein SMACR_01516 [Sordaria macrospora]KAH7634622.1 6-phosphogluconate dehydrogenase [Sordaria sp. MPI-SDFR-AT-0083]CCC07953.1 unnamed protein product [Sordaria macrospora k-hell]